MIYLVMPDGMTGQQLDDSFAANAPAVYVTEDMSEASEFAQSAAKTKRTPFMIAKVVEIARFK